MDSLFQDDATRERAPSSNSTLHAEVTEKENRGDRMANTDSDGSDGSSTQAATRGSNSSRRSGSLPQTSLPVVIRHTFIDLKEEKWVRNSRRVKTEGDYPVSSSAMSPHSSCGEGDIPMTFGHSKSDGHHIRKGTTKAVLARAMMERYEQNVRAQEEMKVTAGSNSNDGRSTQKGPAMVEAQPRAPRSYTWTLESKKLRGNDRSVVSRAFELCIGDPESSPVTFKMMLCAKMLRQGRGGQSFKMARGQGSVQLKCEHDLGNLSKRVQLKISVGSCLASASCGTRSGVVHQKVLWHDFSQSAACTSQDWDFGKAVDEKSQTFVVSVEIMPGS
jgi:hypothetical protein